MYPIKKEIYNKVLAQSGEIRLSDIEAAASSYVRPLISKVVDELKESRHIFEKGGVLYVHGGAPKEEHGKA